MMGCYFSNSRGERYHTTAAGTYRVNSSDPQTWEDEEPVDNDDEQATEEETMGIDSIVGELIADPVYRYADHTLIADVARRVWAMAQESIRPTSTGPLEPAPSALDVAIAHAHTLLHLQADRMAQQRAETHSIGYGVEP